MKVNDIISGSLFVGLAFYLFIHAEGFVSMPGVPYGPKLFPQIISVVLGLAGALIAINGARRLATEGWFQTEDWARKKSTYIVLAAIIAGFFFYIFFTETLGYLLTSVIMLMIVLTASRGPTKTAGNLAIAVVASGMIYVTFSYLLRVPLPVGPLERVLLGYS